MGRLRVIDLLLGPKAFNSVHHNGDPGGHSDGPEPRRSIKQNPRTLDGWANSAELEAIRSVCFWVQSGAVAQPSHGDGHEPAHGGLGGHPGGCRECVEAVSGELMDCDIVAEVPGGCGLGQQVLYQVMELGLGLGDLLVSVKERREFAIVAAMGLARDQGITLEHSFQLLPRTARFIPNLCEIFEVADDLTFVPGEQDRLDICEVLVKRRTPYAGLFSDL